MKWQSTKTLGRDIERGARHYRDRLFDALASTPYVRRALYRSISRSGKLVFCRFADHDIVVDPDDLVGRTLLEHGNFDRQRTDLVARRANALGGGRVVVEIGANIGTQTVYFLATGHFDSAVCLEPDPANVRLLETNLHLNRLDRKVTLLPVGAGDREGVLHLRRDAGNSGGSTLRSEQVSANVATDILVPVVTMDSLVGNGTIDPDTVGLLWIDAEGFEEEIFAGCRILIDRRVPMAFEFSTAFYNPEKIDRIVDLIFARYTDVSIIEGGGFTPVSRAGMKRLKRQVDIFCSG
ncbi:FkbM family methyltransferase [Brevundimonas sp.]|uniref:FkbM family methyltransferase n=1 Tax=Brevundimonas sp. TaxID=1871086 RepID=UPI003A91B604